jgi:hypothetical protein
MKLTAVARWSVAALLPLALCGERDADGRAPGPGPAAAPVRKEIGKNVFFEVEGKTRRVVVNSVVVLREGQLEGLLTRSMAKEHEYILAADCDARHIHVALVAAGAKAGAPVVLFPKFVPARGSPIKISLRYKKGGKLVTVQAGDWVREGKTKKALTENWVFAGSRFIPNPAGEGPPFYVANGGDLICTCNIDTAMLDLPFMSPKKFDERFFEAHTDRIPAKDTPVEIILEPLPVPGGKEKK